MTGYERPPVIRTEDLVLDYGRVRALAGVELAVEREEVFGFLGPNGAGKSTTIRVLLDLLRPTAGRAEVFGISPQEGGAELRTRIGYLPGELALTGRQTADRLLRHLASLRGGRGADRIDELAERFSLQLDRPIRTLSQGNKRKVGIVQAFMHRPELLILDEPTSGLDPLLQQEFRALAREARNDGATVFMSSHVLSEVEQVADRVAVVRQGRIVDVDDVASLRHRAGQRVELHFAKPVDAVDFEGLAGVHDLHVDDRTLTCLLRGEPDPLLKEAAKRKVVAWSAEERELEDLFLDFYRVPEDEARPIGAEGDRGT